ncbi:hypothetical protein BJF82_06130 [Kytococcus sp. CUA-901]|nr:hypothetical protein BJF82_06130 [Kytococcus sp. CUA-901]
MHRPADAAGTPQHHDPEAPAGRPSEPFRGAGRAAVRCATAWASSPGRPARSTSTRATSEGSVEPADGTGRAPPGRGVTGEGSVRDSREVVSTSPTLAAPRARGHRATGTRGAVRF